jgi:hypothetical protein
VDSVFINCPFDDEYRPIFMAIVFCVVDCGFVPRSALEAADSGQIRVIRIRELIRKSRFAIHDLSRVEITAANPLPRFNMPFEFGMDLGCRWFGAGPLRSKRCLVLESQAYRYQAIISDMAGQDPKFHGNEPATAITVVRNWLRTTSGRTTIPGPKNIRENFLRFSTALPTLADRTGLDRNDLQFVEYVTLVEEWLKNPASP